MQQLQQLYRFSGADVQLFGQVKRSHPDLTDPQIAQLIHSKKTIDEISKTAPKFSYLLQEHRISSVTAYDLVPFTDQQFLWHSQPMGRYKTRNNELALYLYPSRFYPKKQSVDFLVRSAVAIVEQYVQSDMDGICNGIVLVCNCADIVWSNFEVETIRELFSALLESLPLKIAAIYLVNAGHLVNAIIKLIKSIVPDKKFQKYLSRTHQLSSVAELQKFIDPSNLSTEFGGQLQYGPAEFTMHWRRLCSARPSVQVESF